MGKHIVGRETRKEGRERARIYTVIECSTCGAKTYERKQRKIEEALKRLCKNCIAIAAVDRASVRLCRSKLFKETLDSAAYNRLLQGHSEVIHGRLSLCASATSLSRKHGVDAAC